jgi:hypothetical protein
MKRFRIYVTNISQAYNVLAENGYNVTEGATHVEIHVNENKKMDVVTLLNRAKVVLYDIEEA